MRRIVIYITTSADGYIDRPDRDIAWLNRPRAAGDYGLRAFYRSIDTILWGRKTYEMALDFQTRGVPGAAFDSKVKNYVFSRRSPQGATPLVQFVTEPIPKFAQRLRATTGKNVGIIGGAGLIGSFLDEGQIDEFITHVIPTFIGEGIPLIAARQCSVTLVLRSFRRYRDGVVRLHYTVARSRPKHFAGQDSVHT